MSVINLFKVKPTDNVVFRCGGFAEVQSVTVNTKHRDVDIVFVGETAAHNYHKNGMDYEHGKSLFDIVQVVAA